MILTSLREALKLKAGSFLEAYLPVRMKRLVCLASLGAFVNGSTSLNDDMISKLNSVMVLGNSDQALKLPVLLSKAIWDGKNLPTAFLSHEPIPQTPMAVALMSAGAIQAMPKWLRYGEDKLILQEIEKLLALCNSATDIATAA